MATLSRVLGALAVTTTLAFAVTVNAQTTTAPSSSPPGSSSTSSISDKKLDAVAAAAKNVVVINRSYKAKVDQAPDAQKQQLVAEANQAMTKAVTDQGLSVDEYMNIMRVAQNDQSVRNRLIERMK
ncbi:MAG TPA: DUF4168 domain-containing protein [Reyranella sp.]|jgi:hypothetical protein|nr:DUF4168 domain-containing protein [Reyranella sp.]